MKSKSLIIAFLLCFFSIALTAQKGDLKITMEKINQGCANLPRANRTLVTVGSFVRSANNAPADLHENMSTALTNALQNIQCFRVLMPLSKVADGNGEIDYGKSAYSDPMEAIEKGKQFSPQVVFTGEVTSYNRKFTSGSAPFVHWEKTTIQISFNLIASNPRTREVLFSQSFDAEGVSNGGGGTVPFVTKFTKNSNAEPALNEALERIIIKSVEYIADHKDQIPIADPNAPVAPVVRTSTITVKNTNYSQSSAFTETFKTLAAVKDAAKLKFENGVATYSIKHTGTTDELITAIDVKHLFIIENVEEANKTAMLAAR